MTEHTVDLDVLVVVLEGSGALTTELDGTT
jgi:hypothetical protein